MEPREDGWTAEWPTETGQYLFYGNYGKPGELHLGAQFKPRLKLVSIRNNVHSVIRAASGEFIFEGEQTGLWKKITPELPDWPK